MKTKDVRKLAKKGIDAEKLSEALEGVLSKKDEIRSNSFKILMHVSEEQTKVLYPKWDYLARAQEFFHIVKKQVTTLLTEFFPIHTFFG